MTRRCGTRPDPAVVRIAVVSTGGTIEKTYDEIEGALANRLSVLDVLLASLSMPGVAVDRVRLMNKDSLEMTADDHALIASTARGLASGHDGVVVVHGTDRLAVSGERTAQGDPPDAAIVFTGAVRPWVMRNTDATQNVTEALLASQLLAPGVYVAMHGRVHSFPGAVKDTARGTFVGGS